MTLWRLVEDVGVLLEGSCISDVQFKNIYFTDKVLFEPLSEDDQKQMIEVDEKNYCEANGVKKVLFYTTEEVVIFNKKLKHVTYLN